MQTGLGALMIAGPLVASQFSWDPILFHGVHASSRPSRARLLKLCTANVTAKIMWVQKILQELGVSHPSVTRL
jgi:hypothetical protein